MADPLDDGDIEPATKLNDGLPQSLVQCIHRYGLTHFKLKVSGKSEPDIDRLTRIAEVIERHVPGDFAFTLDGNESFRSLDGFREFWESLARAPQLSRFLQRAMFVEQPFHRDVALDPNVLAGLAAWRERPALIIDESDADLDSLPRALALGYHGTSHKNCKGVFKGVANACLLELLRRESPSARLVMSGEDLANIGPVALLQDLAVVATLGVTSVERNGHHYFAGLSAFPRSVQEQVVARHGDLYERSATGWPALCIQGGELCLDSVVESPLGVGFELDVAPFMPRNQWNHQKTSQGTNR
jgi:transcriptional regulator with XRE-family HTH domain